MQIVRVLSKGLLIALALTLTPATALSAQKISAGSKCKVYKQKVTYQNKSFTCIKSGKKLVWNKGILVVRPKQSVTPTPTLTPKIATFAPVAVSSKSAKIGNYLEISYLSPINWGGLPANSSAAMKFPVSIKASIDVALIRVLVQHTEGAQKIVIAGTWDWKNVEAGDSKVMDLTIPIAFFQEERLKGYSGGYTFKVFMNYEGFTNPEYRFEAPIDFVLPTLN
jgi:hypothetical protein